MRLGLASASTAALIAALPVSAQEIVASISIDPGETVTARIAGDPPGFVILSRETSPPADAGEPSPVADNVVRFVLNSEGDHAILRVDSGYDRTFHYRAVMVRGERSMPTSICTVVPRLPGFETWPHYIDRLELSNPRFVEVPAGMISCQ